MGEHETFNHTSKDGKTEINLTRYKDKNGKDNYVTQFKKDGKEVFHITKHQDGHVNYTDKDGRKRLR